MRLYLSSFLLGAEPERLLGLLSGPRVLLVANALDGRPELRSRRLVQQTNALHELGLEVEEWDLRDELAPGNQLDSTDLLWVLGGNVFVLREALHRSHLDAALEARREDDSLVYGGYSAGACVVAPTLDGLHLVDDSSEADVHLKEGLGLLPFAIVPHFRSDHPESARVDHVVSFLKQRGEPFVALRDGEILVASAGSEIGDVEIVGGKGRGS